MTEHDSVGEAADDLRERLDEAARAVPPDFMDVLRRAQALGADPALGAGSEPEPEPEALAAAATSESSSTWLHPFVGAYRERLDDGVEERLMHPLPARLPPPQPNTWPWSAGIAAVAALMIVGLAVWRLSAGTGRGVEAVPLENLARDEARDEPTSGSASHPRPRGRAGGSEPAPIPVAEPEPEPTPAEVVAPKPRTEPESRKSVDERIAQLDGSAQAAWRRGDLARARLSFRTITRIGGRRGAAELAYGELFALERQLGHDPSGTWRAYLRKFPRGRYAEDALAGLCQRAKDDEQSRCWHEYRTKFPDGSHGR